MYVHESFILCTEEATRNVHFERKDGSFLLLVVLWYCVVRIFCRVKFSRMALQLYYRNYSQVEFSWNAVISYMYIYSRIYFSRKELNREHRE